MTKGDAAAIGISFAAVILVLIIGDLIKRLRGKDAPVLVPYGVHVLASTLFLLGVVSAIDSWNDYPWDDLVFPPIIMVVSVYAAFLLVCLRIPAKRELLFARIVGLFSR